MIIVKLQGGLGNQMFQYATAASLAKNQRVYIDLSFIKQHNQSTAGFTARPFELGVFKNIRFKFITPALAGVLNGRTKLHRLIKKLFFSNISHIGDHNADLLKNARPGDDVYLDGYFQNERFLKANRTALQQQFQFPALDAGAAKLQSEINQHNQPVSIHVRRADYLKPSVLAYHGVLNESYYLQAIQLINQSISNPHFFVFSDDENWCRQAFNFLGDQVSICPTSPQAWMDMALMSRCKHHIIANSSFSWWAAWLNNYTDQLVVAPKNWFNQAAQNQQTSNLIPDNWLRI